jgi:hypothetical protein
VLEETSGGGCPQVGAWHVYLDQPLANRAVIDGSVGRTVPYRNVYETLFDD